MKRVDDPIDHYYSNVSFGQTQLENAVAQALDGGHGPALDAGCGSDAPLVRKFSDLAWVVGIDLCPCTAKDVPVVQGDLSRLPFSNESFSMIFSRSVFEHLTDPEGVLNEFNRVLKPGGLCVVLTPNRFDYSSVVAALTPH